MCVCVCVRVHARVRVCVCVCDDFYVDFLICSLSLCLSVCLSLIICHYFIGCHSEAYDVSALSLSVFAGGVQKITRVDNL